MINYSTTNENWLPNTLLFIKALNKKHLKYVYVFCAHQEIEDELKSLNKDVLAEFIVESGATPKRDGEHTIDLNAYAPSYLQWKRTQ